MNIDKTKLIEFATFKRNDAPLLSKRDKIECIRYLIHMGIDYRRIESLEIRPELRY